MKSFGAYEKVRHGIINNGGIYWPIVDNSSPKRELLLEVVAFCLSMFQTQRIVIHCCKVIYPWLAINIPSNFHSCEVVIIYSDNIPFQFFVFDGDVNLFSDKNWDKKLLFEPAAEQTGCYMEFGLGTDRMKNYLETGQL